MWARRPCLAVGGALIAGYCWVLAGIVAFLAPGRLESAARAAAAIQHLAGGGLVKGLLASVTQAPRISPDFPRDLQI